MDPSTPPDAEGLDFQDLSPVRLLDAIDAAGWQTDGRINAMNSYENRVYLVGLEDGSQVVAKFYRPLRWSDDAIAEEHAFTAELAAAEVPVIAPLADRAGRTLLHEGSYRFCLFPRAGGRAPELDNDLQLQTIGRMLARLHSVGELRPFEHRPALAMERLGHQSIAWLEANDVLPPMLKPAWSALTSQLLDTLAARFDALPDLRSLRLHGDCHSGNLLWGRDELPHWLDFDDCMMGPAVQDIWMFISGERRYAEARLGALLDGYHDFREFDTRELALIEALRTLRLIHHGAWLARRWQEPTFRQAFPWFGEQRFWDEQILALKEQQAALEEPPLSYD